MTNEEVKKQAEILKEYVIQCRRTVHEFAEPSGTEKQTSAFIQKEIENNGLPYEKVSGTGLLAVLDTGRPGPQIALRADIDALSVPESQENLTGQRTCRSRNPGTCHACGHDAHTAILLGVMKALKAWEDQLCGVVCFCFEEGEEDGRGVNGMLEALSRRRIDTVWALHVYAGLPSGTICVDPGPRMAGAAGVDFTVIGKGGHGSRPDMAVNPVFCAASILTNAATAWVNQIAAGQTVTLGVTSIQGGENGNVIPDTAKVSGSLRFFNMEEGQKAVELFKQVAEHTAAMNKCTIEFGPKFKVLCNPAINDGEYAAIAREALRDMLPKGSVVSCEPWYASESFSKWLKIYPGIFAYLGTYDPENGFGAPHHNSRFDVDEDVLPLGVAATLKYVDAVQKKFQQKSCR